MRYYTHCFVFSIVLVISIIIVTLFFCEIFNIKVFKKVEFDKISNIMTELDGESGVLKLKLIDSKELLAFRFANARESEDMASLLDLSCSFVNDSPSIWLRRNESKHRQLTTCKLLIMLLK